MIHVERQCYTMNDKCSDQLDGDLHHRGHDWSLGKVLHGACSRDRTVRDPTLKINRPDEITGCQHCQINNKFLLCHLGKLMSAMDNVSVIACLQKYIYSIY